MWNGARSVVVAELFRSGVIADWLIIAVMISLPWSTSATSIFIVLWVIAVVPSFSVVSLRREILTAAGGFPVLLWALAALAMLWAETSWYERLQGLRGFHKLLFIPLLLVHFRHSERAKWAIFAFGTSALVLLALSWILMSSPGGLWGREKADAGVPVKDYITQSGIFAICAFGLLWKAIELWRVRRIRVSVLLYVLAAAFIGNIAYVATARTTLIVIVVLTILLGFVQFGWKGVFMIFLIGGAIATTLWLSSPYLRERVMVVGADTRAFLSGKVESSVGLRFTFWAEAMELIAAAPVIGHGTGTIETLFRRDAGGDIAKQPVTGNPHNQILGIAVQLGLIGTLVFVAMWIAHLAMFRGYDFVSWLGLIVVVQNIVSCFFNSHLFDFVQGWIYVIGVGMLGGTVLQETEKRCVNETPLASAISSLND